ncbi:thrombospondin-2-like [Mytilus edulis]|uniref:thrombospondin-2-like n=1 Tax=Mytilus edulis TaxID=6550 RepID=UPI0039F0BE45
MQIDLVLFLLAFSINVISATISEDYGEWGNWGDWSQCSVSCGYGSIHRNKNWIYKNGQVSNYTYSMIVECWTKIACPIDGGWTMWTAWSDCTRMCGGGTSTRTRLCLAPEPSPNGRKCDGYPREEQHCNVIVCPVLPDNFDMSVCNDTTFICKSQRQCISEVFHCDNKLQCHDGSDELPDECRKFNSLNSSGSQLNIEMTLLIIVIATLSVIVTTNHPV